MLLYMVIACDITLCLKPIIELVHTICNQWSTIWYHHNHIITTIQKNSRDEPQLMKYMIDVAMGMHYLSDKGIIHRVSSVQEEQHTLLCLHTLLYYLLSMKGSSCT